MKLMSFLRLLRARDKGFVSFTGRLNTQYEFYEFPPGPNA